MNDGKNVGCMDRLAQILGVAVNSNIYKLASMVVQVDVHVGCGRCCWLSVAVCESETIWGGGGGAYS